MLDFVHDENLKLYRTALAQSTDDAQRKVLVVLLRRLVAERAATASGPKPIVAEH